MTNELRQTVIFCLAAAALATAAVVVDPGGRTPDVLSDQGELFYPDFADPQAPKSIEVIDYNEETATATPLKVEYRGNKWILPSHRDYPADAQDRLASTAAALIELKKDIVITENVEDHAEYGVIDPFDEAAASLVGRGKRVTLRDADGEVLADFVIGEQVPDKDGFRYMRVPGQRRVYAVETSADVSARFQDWIETDLLKVDTPSLRRIAINSYSINERLGRIEQGDRLTLNKTGDDWKLGGRTPKDEAIAKLSGALDDLRIVDAEHKPDGLTASLKAQEGIQLTMESFQSLRSKGYFINQNTGQLLSNEGEIIVDTADGLQYTLRFGEIANTPSASPTEQAAEPEGGERRYVFVTVSFAQSRADQYGGDAAKGKELEEELRNRFADWYYVISGADFSSLRPSRRDLL
ncbi:MAG: DUF4340 domain-containing protein [Acidobacteria bacterium]|nr:DUF4340 domain-containing protein [Acidobacteriota bacterium]MDA1234182.1 DUF4340 domain-containing protein [Acidobacteriota bacterium]